MTKSRFPRAVAEELLTKSGRRCCLCHEYKGGRVEVHHVTPKAEGGQGTAENGIVLCFDCHSDVHAYWKENPKGRKFGAPELRKHRDHWFETFARNAGVAIDYKQLAGELLRQISEQMRPEGARDAGTEDLAKAAGPETEPRLRKAIDLRDRGEKRAAILALPEAFEGPLSGEAGVELELLIGNALLSMSDFDGSEAHFLQALRLAVGPARPRVESITLNNLGVAYAQRGDLQKSVGYLLRSLAFSRTVTDEIGLMAVLSNLGLVHTDLGNLAEAQNCYEEALSISRHIGDRVSEGLILGNMGNVHKEEGALDTALSLYSEALALHRAQGQPLREAEVLINTGYIHAQQGRTEEAERDYMRALEISRAIQSVYNEAKILGNLGLLRFEQHVLDEAEAYFTDALSKNRQIGNRLDEAMTLVNLAHVFLLTGRNDDAEAFYREALWIHRDVGDPRGEAVALSGLGSLYMARGMFDEALKSFREALGIERRGGGGGLHLASVLANIGIVLAVQNEREAACRHLRESLELYRAMGISGEKPETVMAALSRLNCN